MAESFSLITWMAEFQIRFLTWRSGALVGTDRFGNRYYRSRRARPGGRERRWVLYKGEPEATSVPPEWHGWLHHGAGAPPHQGAARTARAEHETNPTGTARAHFPPGHPAAGGSRPRVSADYQAWSPPES